MVIGEEGASRISGLARDVGPRAGLAVSDYILRLSFTQTLAVSLRSADACRNVVLNGMWRLRSVSCRRIGSRDEVVEGHEQILAMLGFQDLVVLHAAPP